MTLFYYLFLGILISEETIALYIDDYDNKINKNIFLRMSRSYLANALTGFLEDAINLKEEISKRQLSEQLFNLCNDAGNYYINQISQN
jgi:hypothetical protein